jgi:hypothetical protein
VSRNNSFSEKTIFVNEVIMKKSMKKWLLVSFAAALFSVPAMAGEVKMSGNVEINLDHISKNIDPEVGDDTQETVFGNSGRAELTAEGTTKAGDLSVTGKGCMELKVDGDVGVCDVFVKVGSETVDVQVGRFEKIGVYGKGLDIMVENAPEAPEIYEANYARGRGPGDVAVHFNGENFTLELGAVYGNEDDANHLGIRPAADVKFGPVGVVAAFENLTIRPQDNDAKDEMIKSGAGIKVTYAADMFDAGLNVTSGKITGEEVNDEGEKVDLDDKTTQTVGGFVTFKFDGKEAGLGYHVTNYKSDSDVDAEDEEKVGNILLLGYSHPLPVEGAAVKLGFSNATGQAEIDGEDVGTSSANAFRVRFWYEF